ncbi:N-acetyltransferase [Pseudomonas sp. Fl5BN2]|uniref:N-acetyltransferase n=1 Tax=Pseudomonas sp. Fl5BN2 TaxID=2697652 RepID=UPI0021140055|nr:N-acetyltransferase [Pseudomonas sp. Fl5BN2]
MLIRDYQSSDLQGLLTLWLDASIQAHHFVDPDFWRSKVEDMGSLYIPNAQTRVAERDGELLGFYCLVQDQLAALFVRVQQQGQGLGKQLLADARERRSRLELAVYADNLPSIGFYRQQGFQVIDNGIDPDTGQAELIMAWPGPA